MPTSITEPQRRWLKKQAHHLKPVVQLGQAGLSDAVLAEIESALDHHELLKVRVNGGDHALRDAEVAGIAARTGATLVQRIGNVAIYYRANPKRREPIRLPA
ncbi:YhbY family RNA-binding protein [Thiohalocapsa marina]|uniref:YhbY family RNA-binding protein n=1 Tax=Thiohalocapsa marina TaxID=424902 RepID=A0A5M8FSS2_9GAMM|nr:YhbY family RNA-binding protein [Thiohalocapsa marina]KAA6185772.1 YhbY family RNA-binding protein [Thiohalocapsa marina]